MSVSTKSVWVLPRGVAGDVVLLLVFGSCSSVDKVLGVVSFFLFPFVDVHRSYKPSIFSPSRYFEWPPFFLLSQSHSGRLPISWLVFLLSIESFCRDDESQIPLGCFSGPFVWIWSGDPQSLSPFQFSLCFNPNLVMLYVSICSIGFFRDSIFRVQSSLLDCLLGLLCCLHHHHRMKYCCLGRIHHVCRLLRESPRLFHRHECFVLQEYSSEDDLSLHQCSTDLSWLPGA